MTDKVKALLKDLNDRQYRSKRMQMERMDFEGLAQDQVGFLRRIVALEKPLFYDNDSFGFNRYAAQKIKTLSGNTTPNYGRLLAEGFDGFTARINQAMAQTADSSKLEFGGDMLDSICVCMSIVDDYRAASTGKLHEALCQVPRKPARDYYEALVCMKCCIYLLRLNFCDHVTFGRFDQYMYPYYLASKRKGMTDEEALELTEEFFISINRDCDVYTGVQVGDNGQSMVLGGFDAEGNSMFNALSEICMSAALELKLIDPKINLRVGKNTPLEIYELATQLTKAGLGFPQYCNDDVVVPGLMKLGYDKADALNYTVAACWEYIIPGCGADVPNHAHMDFPKVVNLAVHEHLEKSQSFEVFLERVEQAVADECDRLIQERNRLGLPAQPFQSLFFDGCIERLTSMWQGGTKYHNFGAHGLGISTAADTLAAIKKQVYDDKTITARELLDALERNFDATPELRRLLLESPKMGNNDDYVDDLASFLMDAYSNHFNNRSNDQGGIWRAGTGSAMYYVKAAQRCPATADGRLAYTAYSCSLSPSLGVKTQGLLSVLQSFTKHDFTNIINGGPLTIELHDAMLRNDVGVQKVAQLVKKYIELGGHQLQLNVLNKEKLKAAKLHPENYTNLIVRVWGWSGYFVELDPIYQEHILSRVSYL